MPLVADRLLIDPLDDAAKFIAHRASLVWRKAVTQDRPDREGLGKTALLQRLKFTKLGQFQPPLIESAAPASEAA